MKKPYLPILSTLLALLISTLACSMYVGGPDYPETRIPVSEDSVTNLKEQMKQASEMGATTGILTLSVSQEQLTSLIAFRLAEQENPFITDPQVYLNNGEIHIYGRAKQGYLEATVGIVMTANVDANGQPTVQLVSADFGPLPAPEGLNQTINALVQEAFTGTFGPIATGFRLESIAIANGTMTISGRTR